MNLFFNQLFMTFRKIINKHLNYLVITTFSEVTPSPGIGCHLLRFSLFICSLHTHVLLRQQSVWNNFSCFFLQKISFIAYGFPSSLTLVKHLTFLSMLGLAPGLSLTSHHILFLQHTGLELSLVLLHALPSSTGLLHKLFSRITSPWLKHPLLKACFSLSVDVKS